MSEHVELAPDGLFTYKWSGKRKKFSRKRVKKLSVATHLRSGCEIAPGTTLKNIFDIVEKYKLLKIIVGQYSWCRAIDEFHAQAAEPILEEDNQEKIDYLEIYWYADISKYKDKQKNVAGIIEKIEHTDFDISTGLHGIGPATEKEDEYGNPALRENNTVQYSISSTPMWKLANLPVKLNKEFTVYEPWPYVDKKNPLKLISANKTFSLLEVLDAIYWDISFYGGPAEGKAFTEMLQERVEEIKNNDVKGIPLEQVMKRLDKEEDEEEDEDDEEENEEGKMKIVLHPDVVKFLGVDPNSIPLDDWEINNGKKTD